MQAVTLERFGGPEVLRVGERADPTPPPGWVVVELRAAALNWHDYLLRAGQYPNAPLPLVPGSDGAGVRRDTGADVVVMPGLHWGDDERAPSSRFEILGDATDGTFAELVALPAENVVDLPAGWSYRDAAALGLAGLTAYRALFTRGGLRTGETVLICGAGGGVASIAIGLAMMAGAHVLVTTSTPDKLERARALGARDGVLYTEDGWPSAIRALAGDGVDLVFDSVGAWAEELETLVRGGRLVTFGATAADRQELAVRPFYFGQYSILGTTMGSPRDFAALLAHVALRPEWRPPVDRVFGLADVADAQALMERRGHTGKVVLDVA